MPPTRTSSSSQPVRVLVTGAHGYVGRAVTAGLNRRGADVIAAGRTDDLLTPDGPSRLIDRVRPEIVVHLAWNVLPGYWTSPENARWRDATITLASAARSAGARRFIGAGTCAEYDWSVTPCDDLAPTEQPHTEYGRAKLAAWRHVHALAREGFSTAWPRIFLLFGDDEHTSRLVPSVAGALLSGQPALCTHGEQVRHFLHVRDVGAAIAAVALSDATGVVNIAHGQPRRVRDVIEGLADRLGGRELVQLGARPTAEPPVVMATTSRLSGEIGWHPTFTFEQALDEAAAYWLRQRRPSST